MIVSLSRIDASMKGRDPDEVRRAYRAICRARSFSRAIQQAMGRPLILSFHDVDEDTGCPTKTARFTVDRHEDHPWVVAAFKYGLAFVPATTYCVTE